MWGKLISTYFYPNTNIEKFIYQIIIALLRIKNPLLQIGKTRCVEKRMEMLYN